MWKADGVLNPSTKVSLCTACEPGAVLALSKHTAFCSQPFFLSPPAQEKGLARGQDLAVCFGERAENNLFTGLLETPNYLVAMATWLIAFVCSQAGSNCLASCQVLGHAGWLVYLATSWLMLNSMALSDPRLPFFASPRPPALEALQIAGCRSTSAYSCCVGWALWTWK